MFHLSSKAAIFSCVVLHCATSLFTTATIASTPLLAGGVVHFGKECGNFVVLGLLFFYHSCMDRHHLAVLLRVPSVPLRRESGRKGIEPGKASASASINVRVDFMVLSCAFSAVCLGEKYAVAKIVVQ
ncbi:MAG: hypothetical protein ABI674_03155 [Spartobacteria bacterium]